jgi:signal transduction histidine kinase
LLHLEAIDRSEAGAVAWRLFVGDLIGTLVATPIILLATTFRPWPRPGTQSLLQLAAIVGALAIVFGYREATAFQLFYLLFLPLLWVALTYGTLGAAVALVIIQIGLVMGAEIRFGAEPGLTALQVLMIALAITGLIVGAIVSEREAGAARLRDQQSALSRALRIRSAGEIAAAIAHEINQPLTAISTYSGIASKAISEKNAELASEAVAKVRAECERANTVIKSIRELLRQGALSKTPLDLRTTLADISILLASDLAAKGVTIVVTVPSDFPIVDADGVQVQQAVHNLVINSADAMIGAGRGGVITVRAELVDEQSYVIAVQDDGPGFPPGMETREPTPFLSTKPDGSGLGLLVVRSIAEAHGGSLAISSSPRGATVTLRLPTSRETNDGDGFRY